MPRVKHLALSRRASSNAVMEFRPTYTACTRRLPHWLGAIAEPQIGIIRGGNVDVEGRYVCDYHGIGVRSRCGNCDHSRKGRRSYCRELCIKPNGGGTDC